MAGSSAFSRFSIALAGLYWKRGNTLGAYSAMISGALAVVPFFYDRVSASYARLWSFTLAAMGVLVGSLLGKRSRQPGQSRTASQLTR